MKYFSDMGKDLTSKTSWLNAGKAAAGGAVASIAIDEGFAQLNKIKFVADLGQSNPANRKLVEHGLKALMGLTTAVVAERYIGEAAAMGVVGATAGSAVARYTEKHVLGMNKEKQENLASGKSLKPVAEVPGVKTGALPDGSVGRHFSDDELQQHLSEMRA